MSVFPYLVGGWIFAVGLYGIVTSRNLVHAVVCLGVVQSATYVFLVAVGYRRDATAPIVDPQAPPGTPVVDPLVQALTLTDIVVSATAYALLLALALQVHKRAGTLDPDELTELRG